MVREYNEILMGLTVSFILLSLALIVIYLRGALNVKKEYTEAKEIIGNVVLSFKRHQDEQDKRITEVTSEIEWAHSTTEKLTGQSRLIEGKISNLITSMKAAFTVNKKVIEYITDIQKEIKDLSKVQQGIQNQLIDFNEKYNQIPIAENINVVKDETPLTVKLTETENQIIQSLLTEGPKTAPQVEDMIGKTREHTARLMKKLWQEGFIERDTHKIPFVYRANEKLKTKLETKS